MLFRCIAVYCLTRAFADESCSSPEADIDTCIPEEETLLLQVGVKLNPAWNSSFDVAVNGNLTFSQLSLHRSVLTSGASFGPKTSAALFLLLSTTFGFLCLCGNAKPFITAPYSGFPDDEDESETVRQQSLVACYFVVFMDAFGFGVYAPFVPVLAKTFSLQAHDIATVLATFSLAQALNTPVLGYLSDRFGRRPVLLAALAAESLSYIILSVAESFTILLIGYIFAGAFCATIGVCNAYIASVSTEEDRPIRLAYSSGSIALGLMLGPVLGAALSHQGFAAAVRICAFLSMLNWTFVFSFMAESPHFLLRRQPKFDMGFRFDSLPRLAWPLFLGAFLGNAGIAAAESCGALYVMDSYFRGTRMTAVESTRFWAWNMFISGAVVIIITYWVFPSLMHRLKQQSTMLLGVCLRIIGYSGLAMAPTKWWFLGAQLFVVTGDCLAAPNLSALLTEVVGRSSYGMALGTLSTFQAAARVLDAVPFATLYERVSHSAPFITVAVLAVASGALWFLVYWQMQLQTTEENGDA